MKRTYKKRLNYNLRKWFILKDILKKKIVEKKEKKENTKMYIDFSQHQHCPQ